MALYTWAGTVTSPEGAAQIQNPYGPTGLERPPVSLATPEGYPVYADEDGEAYVIYIGVSATEWQVFEKDSSAPGDYSTSNRTVQSFLKNHQEVYDGRVAIDMDPDFDGLSTPAEIACTLNPNDNDTDLDGSLEGTEDVDPNGSGIASNNKQP